MKGPQAFLIKSIITNLVISTARGKGKPTANFPLIHALASA